MPQMLSPLGPEVVIDGREMLYFSGTAYFSLQGDKRVIEAACSAVRQYGLHPATSRSGFGESPLLLQVEERAARFFGTDNALVVAAGYAGPSVLMQCAPQPFDLIVADESVHLASQDAAAQSGLPMLRFRHGDVQHLCELLRSEGRNQRVAVMCDGVSPVLGDVAPASDYLDAIDAHGAGMLMLDDAHGVGVLGANGRGTLEHEADRSGRLINVNGNDVSATPTQRSAWMCGTLSKALGGGGGIVPGSSAFIAHLKAQARWYHGAAAPAAPVAAASAEALAILLTEPKLRQRLRANGVRLRQGLRGLGLQVADWPTPIVCVQVGTGANMARIQRELLARGIAIFHSRNYPGVGEEGALRIAVFATHTELMIDRLVAELAALL